MNKPKPKDFGYEPANPNLGEEGGWTIEGGEEAYETALAEWEKQQGPKHTPGPWVYTSGYVYPKQDTAENICYVPLGHWGMDERKANGHLIEAAPEMLAELEKCSAFISGLVGLYVGSATRVLEIEKIIKKAKGE
jgi:hypothetical protein